MLIRYSKTSALVLFALLCMLFLPSQSQAQRTCGTDILMEQAKSTPEGQQRFENLEFQIRNWINQNAGNRTSAATYIIPTVVHIVQETSTDEIPDACVHDQIRILNEDFQAMNADLTGVPTVFQSVIGNCDVEFCLATIDPTGASTTGITRTVDAANANHSISSSAQLKGLIQWDPTKYFNIWVPKNISGGILGYATFPGGAANEDGVVINGEYFASGSCASTPYDLGRTATHEVGHWLGLYHTFQDGCAGMSAADCATAGDNVCDTPPTASPNYGCPPDPNNPPNSCTESPDLPDQTVNFMDYGDDRCLLMFSQGQVDRMQGVLNTTRASLVSQANHSATGCGCSSLNPCAPVAALSADNKVICPGQTVQFTDLSSGPATSWSWSFPGGSPSTSTMQNPTVTYASSGNYDVSLIATNSLGNNTVIESNYITVVQATPPPVMEGFESTLPADWQLYNEDNQGTWSITNTAAAVGAQSILIDNWNYQAQGSTDEIITNIIDLSTYAMGEMTFDYSYKRASFEFDTLDVYFSSDCGETWDLVQSKGGGNLASVTGVSIATPWLPALASDWASDTLDLASYLGSDGFKAKFVNKGWGGNMLYLDNINISALVSAEEGAEGPLWNMQVQPNPFQNELSVQYSVERKTDIEFVLMDVNGREIYRAEALNLQPGAHRFDLPESLASSLGNGIYFLQGRSPLGNVTNKVVKLD